MTMRTEQVYQTTSELTFSVMLGAGILTGASHIDTTIPVRLQSAIRYENAYYRSEFAETVTADQISAISAARAHSDHAYGFALRALAQFVLPNSREMEPWEKKDTDEFFWSHF